MDNTHLSIGRAVLAIVVGLIVGQIFQIILAAAIDLAYREVVTGGRWELNSANVILICLVSLMTGFTVGKIARARGKLLAVIAHFLPLLIGLTVSIALNRDFGNYNRVHFDTKPSLWVWIGLIPAIIGGHLGLPRKQTESTSKDDDSLQSFPTSSKVPMGWNIERIKSFGSLLQIIQGLCLIYCFVITTLWMIKGHKWFAEIILRFHMKLHTLFFFVTLLIIIPLLLVRLIRPYASILLNTIIYIVAGTLWFYSAFYCITGLSVFWFVFGLLFLGFGVTPVAMIGSAMRHEWDAFYSILLMLFSIGLWKLVYYFSHKSVLKEIIRIETQKTGLNLSDEETEEAYQMIQQENNR